MVPYEMRYDIVSCETDIIINHLIYHLTSGAISINFEMVTELDEMRDGKLDISTYIRW